eukprot:sb/3465280/
MGYQLSLSFAKVQHQHNVLPVLQQFVPGVKLLRKNLREHVYTICDYDKPSLINLMLFLENEVVINRDIILVDKWVKLDPLHPIFASRIICVCEIDLGRCATSISLRLPCSQWVCIRCCSVLEYYLCGLGMSADKDTFTSKSKTTARRSTLSRGVKKAPPQSYKFKSIRYTGFNLTLHRLLTLLQKRWLDTKKSKLGIVMKLVIPFLLVFFSVTFLNINRSVDTMKITLDLTNSVINRDIILVDKWVKLDPLHPIFASRIICVCEIDLGRCATSISLRLPCSQWVKFLQLTEECAQRPWNDTLWSDCNGNSTADFGYQYCFNNCFQRDILYGSQGCTPGRRPGDDIPVEWADYFQNLFLNFHKVRIKVTVRMKGSARGEMVHSHREATWINTRRLPVGTEPCVRG